MTNSHLVLPARHSLQSIGPQIPVKASRFSRVIVFTITMLWFAPATSAQILSNLFIFEGVHGAMPQAGLIQATDGNFYGTTVRGGLHNQGVVFRMTPDGEVTTLYDFCSQANCSDGTWPAAALAQGLDGNFYGTTTGGGDLSGGWGTVFKLTADGVLTTLHRFVLTDGATPRGALIQGADGNFYGTTYEGGSTSTCPDGFRRCGTIFKITADGAFSTIYNFCSLANCVDGSNPVGGLLLGKDGNFYGTTYIGGSSTGCVRGCGTAFQFTPSGALTTLHSFCTKANCADGMLPNAALIQAADGNFYSTSQSGGTGVGAGTIFKITPTGHLTTLYSFCSQPGCVDGAVPGAALVQGKDKSLYGTTSEGGAHGSGGTVFKFSPNGQFTGLYSFCARGIFPNCRDGEFPNGLVQGSDGNFYGTAQGRALIRCTNYCGTVFRFGTGLDLLPASGAEGLKIAIVGLNLTGATKVRFNGLAATFVPVSATRIRATVPSGARSGPVKVTTPGGVLTSVTPFTVTH
jgi:uncharacterized repeat protein (TIGR03803 family)